MYTCVHVCVRAHVCACGLVSECDTHAQTRPLTCTHAQTHTSTHTHARTHAHTHSDSTRTHTHTHAHWHAQTQTHIHTHTHTDLLRWHQKHHKPSRYHETAASAPLSHTPSSHSLPPQATSATNPHRHFAAHCRCIPTAASQAPCVCRGPVYCVHPSYTSRHVAKCARHLGRLKKGAHKSALHLFYRAN